MSRLLHHSIESPRPCSYLPRAAASLEHRVMLDVTTVEYEDMLVRGWRRFGPVYFRPACRACTECVSLRVPAKGFVPTRSQRKAANRCSQFRREEGPPKVDAARLALYAAWHGFREEARDWDDDGMDAQSYFEQFAFPHPAAREVAWYDDSPEGNGELVAISLRDQTPNALSLVYFFFHPRLSKLSPGMANVVFATEDASERGIEHLYLGYRVTDCASLRYKAGFGPHELLETRPRVDQVAQWRVPAPAPRIQTPPEGLSLDEPASLPMPAVTETRDFR